MAANAPEYGSVPSPSSDPEQPVLHQASSPATEEAVAGPVSRRGRAVAFTAFTVVGLALGTIMYFSAPTSQSALAAPATSMVEVDSSDIADNARAAKAAKKHKKETVSTVISKAKGEAMDDDSKGVDNKKANKHKKNKKEKGQLKSGQGEYGDDNLYGLVCADFDDDSIYPNDVCNYGDSETCKEKVEESTVYSEYCLDYCNEHEMNKVGKKGHKNPNDYTNSSWAVVCGWEVVRFMQDTCNNTFSASLSKAPSKDEGTKYTWHTRQKTETIDGVSMDACNVHAFCSVCSVSDGTMASSSIHANCEAMVDYYGTDSMYDVTWFMSELDDFWCTGEVQDRILNGTFGDKYGGKATMAYAMPEEEQEVYDTMEEDDREMAAEDTI